MFLHPMRKKREKYVPPPYQQKRRIQDNNLNQWDRPAPDHVSQFEDEMTVQTISSSKPNATFCSNSSPNLKVNFCSKSGPKPNVNFGSNSSPNFAPVLSSIELEHKFT